ncbi:MAG: Phage-related tail protein [Bacillales bacterium]|jgi:TP901 family phage tail tape measure protein|nr:Phage-related tail protein [Bacillales bacterium]
MEKQPQIKVGERMNTETKVTFRAFNQDFNKAIKEMNNESSKLRQEFTLQKEQLKETGTETEKLSAKLNFLKNAHESAGQKVALTESQLTKAKAQFGENSIEVDKLTRQLNSAKISEQKLANEIIQTNRQLTEQSQKAGMNAEKLEQMGNNMQQAGSNIAMSFGVATAAVGAGLGLAVKTAANFEQQLSNVKAVSGATSEEMKVLSELAKKYGATTKYSSIESAQGIEELIKAGVSLKDIINGGLEGALSLATAGELELADAAAIASTALNAFKNDNLTVSKAADLLAGGANASATSVLEMKDGLAQVSAVASGVGVNFKDTTTALSLFANNGLRGSDAGTSLKTMLMNLQPVTKEQKEMFEKLGLVTKDGASAFYDANGKMRPLEEIAGLLNTKLNGLTDAQRQMTLETMFGTDAIRAANILYKEGADGVNKMYSEMSKTTAAEVAKIKMDNFNGEMKRLNSSIESAKVSIGNALIPALTKIADVVQGAVDKFNNLSPTMQKTIAIGGAITFVVLSLITVIGLLMASIGSAMIGFAMLTPVLAGVKTALMALTGPIGIAIAIITTLAIIIYKNWDTIKAKTIEIWDSVKSVISNVANGIKNIISNVFNGIKIYFSTILNVYKTMFTTVWNTIKTATSSVFNSFKSVITNPLKAINLLSIGKDIINGLINGIKSKISSIGEAMSSVGSTITKKIKGVLDIHSPSRVMMQLGKYIPEGLSEGITQNLKTVSSASEQMAGATIPRMEKVVNNNTPISVNLTYNGNNPDDAYSMLDIIEDGLSSRFTSKLRTSGVRT